MKLMTMLDCLSSRESQLAYAHADGGMPTLQSVLNPSELCKYLSAILPRHFGEVQDIQFQVLQHYRGKRCTVNITLKTINGQHEMIGKVYAKDRADVYDAMKEISRAGFGPEMEFSIPQPLAYVPELRLLLQEKVYGKPAAKIFSQDSKLEHALAAERCAKWLAHFHELGPTSGPVFFLDGELLNHWMHRVAKRAGPQVGQFTRKAALLLEQLEILALTVDRTEMCACHGSYSPPQIILTETRTAIFDWDSYCVANPTWDVAKFITKLEQLALESHGSRKALDDAVQVFYETYATTSRFSVAKYLPFYKAALCLRRAKRELRLSGGGLEKAEVMINEGLRILTKEV
jgi:hypothetical protein